MRSFLKRHKALWKLVAAALALVSFVDPLAPAISDFLELGDFPEFTGTSIRLATFLLAIGLLANVFTSYRYSKQPLTVLKSEYRMTFLDSKGHRVRTERRLVVRPEQPGITAKYRTITETQGGALDKDSVTETRVPHCEGDKLMHFGTEKSYLSVFRYANALPYSWLYQLIVPDALCRQFVGLHRAPNRWFQKFLFVERSTMEEIGEYERKEAEFRIVANRYSSSDVRVIITFHSQNLPIEVVGHTLKALTIENAEIESPQNRNGNQTYCLTFHKLKDEIARVGWKLSEEPNNLP